MQVREALYELFSDLPTYSLGALTQNYSYGRGREVGRGLGVGMGLGVELGVAVGLGVTVGLAVAVGLGVGVGVGTGPDCAQYRPPVLPKPLIPPQIIISLPVQTAV